MPSADFRLPSKSQTLFEGSLLVLIIKSVNEQDYHSLHRYLPENLFLE